MTSRVSRYAPYGRTPASSNQGVRQSTRVQNLTKLLEQKERKRKSQTQIKEFSEDVKAISHILQEDGMIRKYPFPQIWESDLELEYKVLDDENKYNLIKNKFKVFNNRVEWLCGENPFPPFGHGKVDNTKINNSLKVSMFLYLTIFNIQYRDTHSQNILEIAKRKDLVLLLSILECFIKNLFDRVHVNQNTGMLEWKSNSLDINTLKEAINSANVDETVIKQFNNLVTLTEIFFGATNVQLPNGTSIEASLIFQHPMKDSPELIILLFDILKNTDYLEQAQVHPGRGSTEPIAKLSVHYIFSLIYSPIFRLTVLFSKYLKTGNFKFLETAIPAQLKKINELNELLIQINTLIDQSQNQNPGVNGELQNKIKILLGEYENIIKNKNVDVEKPEGNTMRSLSQWIVSLDKLNESDLFQKYVKHLQQQQQQQDEQQDEQQEMQQDEQSYTITAQGGGKKNKELEKEIKKISRNALKILKKKELIKEKIKKIDNKLKELDNKKKELGKIYKTKKNKVLKDKIDKTIKNINKEKVNKSEKKKELKKTSNEYKKIDKALKKLKIKNKIK